jgi:hypothetical protein
MNEKAQEQESEELVWITNGPHTLLEGMDQEVEHGVGVQARAGIDEDLCLTSVALSIGSFSIDLTVDTPHGFTTKQMKAFCERVINHGPHLFKEFVEDALRRAAGDKREKTRREIHEKSVLGRLEESQRLKAQAIALEQECKHREERVREIEKMIRPVCPGESCFKNFIVHVNKNKNGNFTWVVDRVGGGVAASIEQVATAVASALEQGEYDEKQK